jgi:hypothetical protein
MQHTLIRFILCIEYVLVARARHAAPYCFFLLSFLPLRTQELRMFVVFAIDLEALRAPPSPAALLCFISFGTVTHPFLPDRVCVNDTVFQLYLL